MVTPEDLNAFTDFLKRGKYNTQKTNAQLAEELHVGAASFDNWCRGVYFPKREKLSHIAEIMSLDLAELEKAYDLSREAKESLKLARRRPKFHTKDRLTPDCYGSIGSLRSTKLMNPQTMDYRRGRS